MHHDVVSTAADLRWPGPDSTVVRVAQPEDAVHFKRLIAVARISAEPTLVDGIESGNLGELLLSAYMGHGRAVLRAEAEAAHSDDPISFFGRVSLPLIAMDFKGVPAGALQALVPGQIAAKLRSEGCPWRVVTSLAIRAAKISAIGVDPRVAHLGYGTALLRACCSVYFAGGYPLVFGYFRREDPGFLGAFYENAGFSLSSVVTIGLDAGWIVDIGADEDQRMFAMKRAAWTRFTADA